VTVVSTTRKPLTDHEWVALAVADPEDDILISRGTLAGIHVESARSVGCDGRRMHLAATAVREPGLWTPAGEAIIHHAPYPNIDTVIPQGPPTHRIDVAEARPVVEEAFEEGRRVLVPGATASMAVNAGYLLAIFAGAIDSAGLTSRVEMMAAQPYTPIRFDIPLLGRTAVVMQDVGRHERDPLDLSEAMREVGE
jgi:hypothetical protein